jgi:hypothetical protein
VEFRTLDNLELEIGHAIIAANDVERDVADDALEFMSIELELVPAGDRLADANERL